MKNRTIRNTPQLRDRRKIDPDRMLRRYSQGMSTALIRINSYRVSEPTPRDLSRPGIYQQSIDSCQCKPRAGVLLNTRGAGLGRRPEDPRMDGLPCCSSHGCWRRRVHRQRDASPMTLAGIDRPQRRDDSFPPYYLPFPINRERQFLLRAGPPLKAPIKLAFSLARLPSRGPGGPRGGSRPDPRQRRTRRQTRPCLAPTPWGPGRSV